MDTFAKESDFEEALIAVLKKKGWEDTVIKYPTEKDLIRNWADILFSNNRSIDRLDKYPLTDGEMDQILDQIKTLKTPMRLNGFLNGKTVAITRDNPDDVAHFGKEISLKIYDRAEIAAGDSRYQIVQQPQFERASRLQNDRRGDIMLLINGMPVIHLELKKSGVDVSQATNQIEKYMKEGIFRGLFSLVQVFVAMTPSETLYFANPGPEGKFNKSYFFHWANRYNDPINDWKKIAEDLLSIPMAHQLIGFYTVADGSDGVLKVMRSYQYYAASRISEKVLKKDWLDEKNRGGFIWHTTGSGKTMTSFKSAQLIASSKKADKVVFMMDRIELGTQSLKEYRGFAGENESVQETEDTYVLISKLKSIDPADTLIVTSIQKMSKIDEDSSILKKSDLDIINKKKIVFIVDEAHRDVFGDMMNTIKRTFPHAILFGFTGTPIMEENQKNGNGTTSVFGDELHRYSIADGIRDGNVLGFDLCKVSTFSDYDIRHSVALRESGAVDDDDAVSDPAKSKKFFHFMNDLDMAGTEDSLGKKIKGIEDFVPTAQYETEDHRKAVVGDIKAKWTVLSRAGKFHAILATSSIPEAIEYYRLFKKECPELRITGLFDPSIDNNNVESSIDKEKGLLEMLEDYNNMFGQHFTMPEYPKFKKDVSARLAHKKPYERIDGKKEQQLDILIVVNQMLTGFDSKWINTLYLDKVLEYENLIQAFSRTNRLFGFDKPFGTIKYYRRPHTMEKNIEKAVKLYSGDKPFGLFADHLKENIAKLNFLFSEIKTVFESDGIEDFASLPVSEASKAMFAKDFSEFCHVIESAKIQDFRWDKREYEYDDEGGTAVISVEFTEHEYDILVARYKELFDSRTPGGDDTDDIPFAIDTDVISIQTGRIDADYMNSKFKKFRQAIADNDEKHLQEVRDELHSSFAYLSQEEQIYADSLLKEIEWGAMYVSETSDFSDLLNDYIANIKSDKVHKLAESLGLDEGLLRSMMNLNLNENNINEFGRLDSLKESVDKAKASEYFSNIEGKRLPMPKVNIKTDKLLRAFILSNGEKG